MSPELRNARHCTNLGFSYFPKMPCLRASELPPHSQKKMWDFPQVTSVWGSVGWNSTHSTTSLVVLSSATLLFFCQSQTVSMWSLQSSITLRWWPESALEKASEPTPLSKVPRPRICSVDRLTLSHTRTWGCTARPSLSTPAICPVAIRILSGWTARHLTQSVWPR